MNLVIIIAILVLLFPMWKLFERKFGRKKWPVIKVSFASRLRRILGKNVSFYKGLSSQEKRKFEYRVMRFLQNHEISTAGTRINETDLALVGASAVIPVFRFDRWRYRELDEVVVFGPSFDRNFSGTEEEGRVVGLLGTGDLDRKMFLCRNSLRKGFAQEEDGDNTAIHEFVHLVDKMDGRVDGIPKLIIRRQYVLPWLDLIKRKIGEIEDGESDLNPYGANGNEEFLAVTAEYFFECPEKMKARHPELHRAMQLIFENPV
jgi:MtfA peptidase